MAEDFVASAQQYKKLTQREHVLLRPGMYVGSIEPSPPAVGATIRVLSTGQDHHEGHEQEEEPLCDLARSESSISISSVLSLTTSSSSSIPKKRKLSPLVLKDLRIVEAPSEECALYVPGLYKIFDEILVNALDQVIVSGDLVRHIDITIKDDGVIEVRNDGVGLPVEMSDACTPPCYVPELIFGHMLTSANYSEDTERTVGGQNGIGAKACNIFSEFFEIETLDTSRGLLYKQRFEANMSTILKPDVKVCRNKRAWVKVSFLPDYARFGLPGGLPDIMKRVMQRRIYDIAALTPSYVTVTFNGDKIPVKTFEQYVSLHTTGTGTTMAYECIEYGWEVAVCLSLNGFQQVSFVNGLNTIRGGKHVDHVMTHVCKRVLEYLRNPNTKVGRTLKKDASTLKPLFVRESIFVFVRATIPDPTFDSQAKEMLTTPATKFAGKIQQISDKFIEKICKLDGFVERISTFNGVASDRDSRKTDGAKRSAVYGIKKLDDAEWAGTAKSDQCTLILTEGDSAKAMAVAGLSVVGRQKYGVYPLRGKLLNVRDVSADRIAANEEIANLKKILGLQSGRDYASTNELRYGRVMIMTDQDVDGSHIKGLVFNMLHQLWPSLVMNIPGFVTSMLTPIVKATPKSTRGDSKVLSFYSLSDYEKWLEDQNAKQWTIKYYKGLGTSTSAEAREYFKELRIVTYHVGSSPGEALSCEDALARSFDKKRANDRKVWLQSYERSQTLDYNSKNVSYQEFVDLDLKHFSNYDVLRSIPSVVDGLKVSQRKALFGCFKRPVTSEMRVAQLAAYAAEHSLFHHGETSMQGTIIGMAQTFVGSGNNINLLEPVGQFGSRLAGGTDHASPRYIHTHLTKVARLLFPAEDDSVLDYEEDDGIKVEPTTYVPVIPLVLVNGAVGIGTGYSTQVPCHNPNDIIAAVRHLLDEKTDPIPAMAPWYKGFTGSVVEHDGKHMMVGRIEKVSPLKIRISELPVGMWTDDFKDGLETLATDHPKEIKSITNESTEDTVGFVVTFGSAVAATEWMAVDPAKGLTKFEVLLKMHSTKPLATTNMHLFNSKGQIQKFDNAAEILTEFFTVRLNMYAKRRECQIEVLQNELDVLSHKVRFVHMIVTRELDLHEADNDLLESLGFPEEMISTLLGMPLSSLTKKRKDALEKEKESKQTELDKLVSMTSKDLYRIDLDKLEQCISSC